MPLASQKKKGNFPLSPWDAREEMRWRVGEITRELGDERKECVQNPHLQSNYHCPSEKGRAYILSFPLNQHLIHGVLAIPGESYVK